MSCVTSREVAGPVVVPAGGSGSKGGDGRWQGSVRAPRKDHEDERKECAAEYPDDVSDLVGGRSARGLCDLSLDCNCNVQPAEPLDLDMEWGYADKNGPATWHKKYPLAAGPRQSPVDLRSAAARTETRFRPLYRRYNPQAGCTLSNTGYGWKVQIAGPTAPSKGDLLFWFSELSGGPLGDRYRLEQFHMHWGDCDNEGSEHTVDGQSYAGELHLVHWNCDKYDSFSEAAAQPDGLAVLGVFLKIGEPMKELQKVTDLMGKIAHKGQQVPIDGEIDPTNLLPDKSSYWTYLGSLTTPPCNESVIWIVFKEPLTISQDQLESMRSLRCYGEGETCPCDNLQGVLLKNYRPPLPLGSRELHEIAE